MKARVLADEQRLNALVGVDVLHVRPGYFFENHLLAIHEVLKNIVEPIGTTIPVLTEAFHLLSPGSLGTANLIHFIADGGLALWFLDPQTMERAFELMQQYADHPMDLADASLVAMAEAENLHKVFTIDRKDFAAYRIKRGHRLRAFELIEPARMRR